MIRLIILLLGAQALHGQRRLLMQARHASQTRQQRQGQATRTGPWG